MSRQGLRRSLGAVILLLLAASAIYGGGFFGVRDRLPPPATKTKASPFTPVAQNAPSGSASSVRRSQPYWVPLERFEGMGPLTTPPFAVDSRALQWRAEWRCDRGRLQIQPERPSGQDEGHRLADTDSCPESGTGVSVADGDFRLDVKAEGRWVARVEQQVDVPLIEPPTPEMTSRASRVVADGDVYDIDENGEGSVRLYREPDGSVSLRLERFYVTPNVDLEIRFSELARPESTKQVAEAPHKDMMFLKATTGSMNYRIPAGAFNDRIRSVVIWCEITRNAYAAASLDT